MDQRITAYAAGLIERMERMTAAQRKALIAAIRRTAKEPVSRRTRQQA